MSKGDSPSIAFITRSQHELLYVLLFVSIGFFISGNLIGKTNYLLDMAPSRDRLTYISLTGTLSFPVSLFPLVGGLIVQHISYELLFSTTGIFILFGFIFELELHEHKNKKILQIQDTTGSKRDFIRWGAFRFGLSGKEYTLLLWHFPFLISLSRIIS